MFGDEIFYNFSATIVLLDCELKQHIHTMYKLWQVAICKCLLVLAPIKDFQLLFSL